MRYLLWTNIIIAGSAAGWTLVAMGGLNLPLDWALATLAFLLALAFYTRDRLDARERAADLLTMPERTAWIKRHAAALKVEMWLGFAGAALILTQHPRAILPLLAGVGFALSYTIRWLPRRVSQNLGGGGDTPQSIPKSGADPLPRRDERVGWKHLPGMKMPFVAILWTLTTVVTPAAVYGRVWQWKTWLLAGAVCSLLMVQILLNDLRDLDGDRKGGTKSLPVILGDVRSRRVGYGLAAGAVLLSLPVAPVPIAITAIYSAVLLQYYRPQYDVRWRLWIEAQGIAAGLITLVMYVQFR